MVSGGSVRSDASSLKSMGSECQSLADGLSSSWEGASHDNFVSGMSEISSEYISAIESQMEAFASACDSYEKYKQCKEKIEETEALIQEAQVKYNEAVSKKDTAGITSWSNRLNTLTTELETLKTELETLKSEIESSLASASSTSLSATATSAHVSGTRSSSVGGSSSKSGATSLKQAVVSLGTSSSSGGSSYSGGSSSGGGSYSGGTSSGTVRTANTGTSSSSSSSTSSSTGTTSTTRTTGKNVTVGNLDMNNYPTGDSTEDGIQRAVLVAKYLMVNGGFTAEQAAAIVGVYIDENNCDPGEVMQAEKDGYGVAGTGGNGYGAGIGSWTFEESKRQVLTDAGFDPNTPIESLSLQEQCDLVIAESQKSSKYYYDALRRCETLEDASATAVLITGGVGYSNNWDTHPTQAEAKAMSDWYGRSNDANFGASEYHWNLDVRRLEYAKEVYNRL